MEGCDVTTGAVAIETGTAAGAPPPMGGDAFTAEEQAVLDGMRSGAAPGAKPGAAAPGSAGAVAGTPHANPVAGAPAQPGADDAVDGEITLGGDGQARDAKTGRFVPHQAYQRVKDRNKELSDQANSLAEKVIRQNERMAIYTELSQPAAEKVQQPQAEREIDPTEDIFGAFEQLKKKNAELLAKVEKTATETQAQFESRALREYVEADATRFAKATPDFQEALRHAITVQDAIETRMGNADPAKRQEAINEGLRNVIATARKANKSWAEMVYDIAKAYGYQPKTQGSIGTQPNAEAAAEIERINRGQQAAVTLSGSGSNPAAETMTLVKLADLPEREFMATRDQYIARNGPKAWDDFTKGRRSW